jgi:hypothetical protein
MNPTFLQIWTSEGWLEYLWESNSEKSRLYFQVRSVVRLALWVPFFYGCTMIILNAVAVFR